MLINVSAQQINELADCGFEYMYTPAMSRILSDILVGTTTCSTEPVGLYCTNQDDPDGYRPNHFEDMKDLSDVAVANAILELCNKNRRSGVIESVMCQIWGVAVTIRYTDERPDPY